MKQILMPIEEYEKEKIDAVNFGKLRGLETALAYFKLSIEEADKMVFEDDFLRNQMGSSPLLSIKKIARLYDDLLHTNPIIRG